MHDVAFDLFPEGKAKALALSYDDGVQSDRQLVELLNAHGLRGTFHIHSAELDRPYHLRRGESASRSPATRSRRTPSPTRGCRCPPTGSAARS